MMSPQADRPALSEGEIAELRARLREAEETLDAIRNGDVDAVVVGGPSGQQVYTLKNADRPYRVLIEQMQEGAITIGKDLAVLYCNERFAAMVELKREHLIGSGVGRFFVESELARFRQLLDTSKHSNASAEFTLRTERGRNVPVNISLAELMVEEGGAQVICGVVTDLGLIRKRADELAAANARLATEIDERRRVQGSLQIALDAAGMGSWDLDLRRGIALRSLRHDQLFGHAEMQLNWTLETAIDHFLPADRRIVTEAFNASRRTGGLDFEARIRRADDGSTHWLHLTGRTFYEGGVPVRIAGVVADITERRAVAERMRHAQKIEAIGQLTGGVAHDFNNLLTVISGGLQMIERQPDPERRERLMVGMRQAVARGSGLSRQLLSFSRRQILRPEPVDLVRQISTMQDLLDRSLRGDVEVRTELDHDLWLVEVDPGELELVILNLAVNARDAMPDGGVIIIRGANIPDLDDGELQGDFVRLSVCDTGTGMPADVMARVFEPYFTTKEIGQGSGLGLAQAHGFAAASGGTIRIESVLGVGTEIFMLLPRTLKAPVTDIDLAANTATDPGQACASAGHVLLVEDDDEVAALTVEMIEHLGYATTRVANAAAALSALADGQGIDLVFSDVMMPGSMNGVELIREIRRLRPGLPVLLSSGNTEAVRRHAEVDRTHLLAKPYLLNDLAEAFKRARLAKWAV